MTEVPDHLLQRSRERRAALGLGGGEAPSEEGSSDAPASPEPAASSAPAPTPAPAAAPPEAPPPAPEPEPVPPYVEASLQRKRIPLWAFPVLAFLPLWGYLYAATLSPIEEADEGQLAMGAELYDETAGPRCASCHAPTGGGGVGRQLSDGEVLATFPSIAEMIEFVAVGTDGFLGDPIGDPDREGGAHIAGEFGNMPSFRHLADEQLLAVVRHEREVLSGEEVPPELIGDEGELLHANGESWIDDAGNLVDAEGNVLLDEAGFLANPGVAPADVDGVEAASP